MKSRKYKSGTSWCIWRWTDVDSQYITRLHLVKTPWFAICIHWLNKPDAEPYLHDHPVSFLSFILKGQYIEEVEYGILNHKWYNFVPFYKKHRIININPNTVTLVFMGPKRQEWGFYTNSYTKVLWKDYYNKQRNGIQL